MFKSGAYNKCSLPCHQCNHRPHEPSIDTFHTLSTQMCPCLHQVRFPWNKMHTLGLPCPPILCSGIWQIRKEALLLLIQFIRWKQLCFQVLMVRSNDRQSLSHWYCRSNVLQCCIYGVFCWGTLNQFTQFSNLIKCICFEVSQQFAFLELFVLLNNIRQLLAFLLYVTVTGGLQLCTRKF